MEQRETWTSGDISGASMAGSSDIGVEGGEVKEERGKRNDVDREIASEEDKSSSPLPAVDHHHHHHQQQEVSVQGDQRYGAGPESDIIGERVGVVARAAYATSSADPDPYDVVPTDWELLTLSQMGLSQFGPSADSSVGNPAGATESISMLDESMLDASTLSSVLGDSSFIVPPGEGRGVGEERGGGGGGVGGGGGGGGEGIFPLPSPSDVVLMERASEALGGLHASEVIPPSYGLSPRGIISTTHEEVGLPGGGGGGGQAAASSPPFITTWQRAGYGTQSSPGPLSVSPLSTATGREVLSSPRSSPPRLITADVKSSVGGGDHQERKHGQGEGTSLADSLVGRKSTGGRDGQAGGEGVGGQFGENTSLGGSLGEDAWKIPISSSGLGGGLQMSLSGSVGSRLGASQVVAEEEGSDVGKGGASSEYDKRRSSVMSMDTSTLTNADDSDLTSTDTSGVTSRQDERGGIIHVADQGVVGTAPGEGVSGGVEGEKEEVEERDLMMRRAAVDDDRERRYYDMSYIDRADEEKQQEGEPVGYAEEGEGEEEEGMRSIVESCIGSGMPSHAVDGTDVPGPGSGQGGKENHQGGETEGQVEGSTASSAGGGGGVQQQGRVAEDGKMTRNGNESILSGRWWRWSWYELWHNRQLLLRQCQATLRGQSGTLWSIGVVATILGLLLVGNQWYWERWQNQQARNQVSKKDEMIDDLRSQMLRWKDGFVSRYRVPVIRTASGSVYSGSFH